jgi:protein-disulfide isomerase
MGQLLARRVVAAGAAGALAIVIAMAGTVGAASQPEASPSTAFGPDDAAVVVTVFSDFACEPCAHLAVVLQGVLEARPDSVRIVFRHLPAEESRGQAAHLASLAAAEQGRFFDFHNLAFANQNRLTRDDLLLMADQLGLDVARFTASLQNPAWPSVLERDRAEAAANNLLEAPAVLLNGAAIRGPFTLSALLDRIDGGIAAAR